MAIIWRLPIIWHPNKEIIWHLFDADQLFDASPSIRKEKHFLQANNSTTIVFASLCVAITSDSDVYSFNIL